MWKYVVITFWNVCVACWFVWRSIHNWDGDNFVYNDSDYQAHNHKWSTYFSAWSQDVITFWYSTILWEVGAEALVGFTWYTRNSRRRDWYLILNNSLVSWSAGWIHSIIKESLIVWDAIVVQYSTNASGSTGLFGTQGIRAVINLWYSTMLWAGQAKALALTRGYQPHSGASNWRHNQYSTSRWGRKQEHDLILKWGGNAGQINLL